MSTVLRRPESPGVNGKHNGTAVAARAAAVAQPPRPKMPTRRRWGRAAAGIAAACAGCWVFASLYLSAGDRTEALVLTRTVPRFEAITRNDLRLVRIASDTEAAHIDASQVDRIVGRVAASDLAAESLLAESQLLPASEKVLKPDEAVIGLLLAGGDAQIGLRRGSKVVLVIRPPTGTTNAATTEVPGWIYSTAGEVTNTRDRAVEVVVSRTQAAAVSAAGADKRVTIVMLAD